MKRILIIIMELLFIPSLLFAWDDPGDWDSFKKALGSLEYSIIPQVNDSLSLGSSSYRFTKLWVKDIDASGTIGIALAAVLYSDLNMGDATHDSGQILFTEGDVAGDPTASLKLDEAVTGNFSIITASGTSSSIYLIPSGDATDYFEFKTVTNTPTITTVGAADIVIDATGSSVGFADDNIVMGDAGGNKDCGILYMIKGNQACDPQVTHTLSTDANGNYGIVTSVGDITLTSQDDIFLVATGNVIETTLTATGKLLLEGDTTRTGTTEILDIDATVDTTIATDDVTIATIIAGRAAADTGGTRGWGNTITTGNMANGEWSYNYGGTYITSACATATANSAVFYAGTSTTDAQCNDYGIYITTGYDVAAGFDGLLNVGAGTAGFPSISFLSDQNTGIFSQNADTIGISAAGAEVVRFGTTSFVTNLIMRPYDAASFNLQGAVVDGANIAVKIGNTIAITTAGGKIVSFYSDAATTERAYINYLGTFGNTVSTNVANSSALNLQTTNTATTGNTAYGIYNTLASSAVVTGTNQNLYGHYNTITKLGADTSVDTTTLYGTYSSASNTGSTVAGTKNTYGGYFTATGDTAGTSNTYGVYASATGGDQNYAGYFVNSGSVTPMYFEGNVNNYCQFNAKNINAGASASTDYVATADTGTETTNYINMGINSSGYTDASFTITGALDGYLYTSNSDLVIGTALAAQDIVYFTNGTLAANERMRLAGFATSITTTTEDVGLNYSAVTKNWATGAIATQREILINAPTYTAAGASVITNAATLAISAAPIASTNITITNPYAFWVQSGNARVDGTLITGKINLADDGGEVNVMDMAVTSTPVAGTDEGYIFNIDTQPVFEVAADSDGAGSVVDQRIEIVNKTILRPSADQSRDNDSTIVVDNTIVRVVGSGGAVILDTAPAVEDGIEDGQIVIIQGTSDANTVQIADNCNVQLAGGIAMTLGKGDTLTLQFDLADSDWYEVSRSDN